jgi:hypothetical protein
MDKPKSRFFLIALARMAVAFCYYTGVLGFYAWKMPGNFGGRRSAGERWRFRSMTESGAISRRSRQNWNDKPTRSLAGIRIGRETAAD